MRRAFAAGGALAVVGVMLMLFASPAGAVITGPCTASGVFFPAADADPDSPPGPHPVDASATGTITVPDIGFVDWRGQVGPDPGGTEERPTAGSVAAVLPPVFDPIFGDLGSLTDIWTWGSDDATETFSADREDYEVPGWVPRGITIVVAGGHSDATFGACAGTVRLKIPGSPISSPVTVVSVLVTAGAVITVITAGIQVGEL